MKLITIFILFSLPILVTAQTQFLPAERKVPAEVSAHNFDWYQANANPLDLAKAGRTRSSPFLIELDAANMNVSVNYSAFNIYLVAANPLDTNWDRSTNGQSILDRELDPMSDVHLIPDPRDFLTAGLRISF